MGNGQLLPLVEGAVTVPERPVSLGFLCNKGKTSALKTEVLHAAVPWTPDAVCLCAPGYDDRQSIPATLQDFCVLLSAVCDRWPKVFVLDFPPDLQVEPFLQGVLRKEYRTVGSQEA